MHIAVSKNIVEHNTACGPLIEKKGVQSISVYFEETEQGLEETKELVNNILDLVTQYSKQRVNHLP